MSLDFAHLQYYRRIACVARTNRAFGYLSPSGDLLRAVRGEPGTRRRRCLASMIPKASMVGLSVAALAGAVFLRQSVVVPSLYAPFGVDPGTVQRISRPFDRASIAKRSAAMRTTRHADGIDASASRCRIEENGACCDERRLAWRLISRLVSSDEFRVPFSVWRAQ
jgi:hypothetical protein